MLEIKATFLCQITWEKVGKLESPRGLVNRRALNMNRIKRENVNVKDKKISSSSSSYNRQLIHKLK